MAEPVLPLSPAARRELARLAWAEAVDSTQDWAMREPLPERGSAVFLADHQHAGRGRRGRAWRSPPGATLALSVLRAFDLPLPALAPLGLAAAVAVAAALRDAGIAGIGLKWPNDLVVGAAKLGGLLVEVRVATPRPALVLGLGLNRELPPGFVLDQPCTDLARQGLVIGSQDLARRVLDALLPALARFEAEGFAPFAAEWPTFDVLSGQRVRVHGGHGGQVHAGHGGQVHAGHGGQEGLALGLAADGGLRVRHDDGERVHHAGEVSVRVAA
ncbi:MAG: biotin--[acetyl-CoA-carboxylase] ligase [Xanthomonadaceae bacterium]|nr:biotin--[acetyl-CoA-carboxylase] ligase [Xanthomonadaceae bacterium]